MSNKITREALEGMGFVKDFEVYRFCYPYARDRGWIEVIIERKNVSVCANAEWNGFIEVPVATLPQLRRLIRSLFGDEALPRRELSSITDEECVDVLDSLYPTGTIAEKVMKFGEENGDMIHISGNNIELIINKSGHMECYSDNYSNRHYPNFASALSLLVDMDFHLPAFHGERDR